jgi:hypothetical protein
MPSKFILKMNDYDPERSNVNGQGLTLTAANFDAQHTAAAAFVAGVGGISLGMNISWELTEVNSLQGNPQEPATTPLAQRENKWLVGYHETTGGERHSMEVPCADLTLLDPNNRGYADLADAAVIAFVTAFEAFIKSDAGLGVAVDWIKFVGRNL